MTRACYEAGRDSGLSTWFDATVRWAQRIIANSRLPLEQAAGYHLLGVSLPRDQHEKRLAALRRGLAILDESGSSDRTVLLITARIVGSLAEQLSYGDPTEREEARLQFERGLSIRQTHHLGDLPGQARAIGGLGRLAFFSDPPDYARARRYFLDDLAIAEEIGDKAGQSLCHSLLAGCDRAAGDLTGGAGALPTSPHGGPGA